MSVLKVLSLFVFSCALVTLGETFSRLVRGIFFWFDIHVSFWANLILLFPVFLLFLSIGMVGTFLGRGWGAVSATLAFTGITAFLGLLLPVLDFLFERDGSPAALAISGLGMALLSVLAFRLTRYLIVRCRSERKAWSYLFHFVLFWLPSMVFALVTDLYGTRSGGTDITNFDAAKPSKDSSPNIVLVTLDTFRFDLLEREANGIEITPMLNRRVQESVTFTHAAASSSWTLPSHASLFTGLQPDQHNATKANQSLDYSYETIAEILASKGYETKAVVGGPYLSRIYGIAQGFQLYWDRLDFFEWRHTPYLINLRKVAQAFAPSLYHSVFQADGELGVLEISKDVLAWLTSRVPTRPYFLFLNLFDAHDPYNLGAETRHLFARPEIDVARVIRELDTIGYHPRNRYFWTDASEDFIQDALSLYYAEAYYLDKHFDGVVKMLQEYSEDTYFIVTSDHGEEFFEHGGVFHDQTLYEEVIRVPLLIFGPGLEPLRIADRVETRRLFHLIKYLSTDPVPSSRKVREVLFGDGTSRAYLEAREGYYERRMRSTLEGVTKTIEVEDPIGRLRGGVFSLRDGPFEVLGDKGASPAPK